MIPEKMLAEKVKDFGETPAAVAAALLAYNLSIIDAIEDIVPAVKPQIAMYERYGLDGLRTYLATIEYARSRGLFVIGDVKRGDIASTAEAYASHISPVTLFGRTFELWNEDAVTLNPSMGSDSVGPFLKVLEGHDRGIFLLVKTSNKGSADIQDVLVTPGGQGDAENIDGGIAGAGVLQIPLYEHVAGLVSKWGEPYIGASGYSKVGAVVGATHPEVGARLRGLMPHTFFLVPGYGAQGGTAADIQKFFDRDGRGCIVNSSRGIIAAWKNEDEGARDIGEAARAAAIKMRDEIREHSLTIG
jgi:orotidine-5'-phosphate decarboxylase